jgi:sodium-type flagellar protein MotY
LHAITVIGSQALTALMPMQFYQLPENTDWNVSVDSFQCAMVQSLPGVGEIRFMALPSGDIRFILDMEQGRAPLLAASVSVKSSMLERPIIIGHERFPADSLSNHQAVFESSVSYVMAQLQNGYGLRFQVRVENEDMVIDSGVSQNVEATRTLRNCIFVLANFAGSQPGEFKLEYQQGQVALNQEQMMLLSDLAQYIRIDREVRKVLIDGHTDDVGATTANLLLSRERAEFVAALLAEEGVSKDIMEVRAHGDRYPLNSNEGSTNNNRRVEIRLVRPIP